MEFVAAYKPLDETLRDLGVNSDLIESIAYDREAHCTYYVASNDLRLPESHYQMKLTGDKKDEFKTFINSLLF